MKIKNSTLIISIFVSINCCFIQSPVDKIIKLIIENQKISKEDIQNVKNLEDLRILRNSIFAKHGRLFNDKNLKSFFEKQSWYSPKKDSQITLTEIDKINLNLIRNSESSIQIEDFLNQPKKKNMNNLEIAIIGDWDNQPVSSSGYGNKHSFLENGLVKIYEDENDCQKQLIASFGTWKIDNNNIQIILSKKLLRKDGQLIPASGSCGSDFELIDGYLIFEDIIPTLKIEYKNIELTNNIYDESADNKSMMKTDKLNLFRLPK
ncbi:YARHG domain-containing protein [Leptospira sp. 85282-16]|uniref:YARHG domain-containing protein n=1 Tax=Leptospira sp. 85282-16 TaxID=2971256 RepID=UPI0021C1217A|nr:YARHG domain-containing protein [Leptospira sp. 85282-16]MCT8335839.1 YARHG domain-containing protein [Leptospira sp. 85282-16]